MERETVEVLVDGVTYRAEYELHDDGYLVLLPGNKSAQLCPHHPGTEEKNEKRDAKNGTKAMLREWIRNHSSKSNNA